MRIFFISDLHLGSFPAEQNDSLAESLPKADVLCLLGDYLASDPGPLAGFLDQIAHKYRHILYILGNHDYWGGSIKAAKRIFMAGVKQGTLLYNGSTVIEGITFYGGTLFYPETAAPDLDWCDERKIQDGIEKIPQENQTFKRRLGQIEKTGKLVVMSHHLPSAKCVVPKFEGYYTMPFFVDATCEPIISKIQPDLWLHGHTHEKIDTFFDSTRILCNPRGYRGEHPDRFIQEALTFGLLDLD